jgi:hypothetical protein
MSRDQNNIHHGLTARLRRKLSAISFSAVSFWMSAARATINQLDKTA